MASLGAMRSLWYVACVKKGGVLFPALMMTVLLWACEPPAADSPKVSKKVQNQQGIKYLEGAGVTKDEKKAFQWFKKAATELDYAVKRKDSGRSIGVDYGIPFELLEVRNPGLDLERLRPGQKMLIPGHPGAQFNLAALYEKGGDAVTKDIEKAAAWYKKSADAGFTQSEFMMGWLHREGEGVPKDPEQAVEWYSRAAAKGLEGALYNLGTLYAVGDDPVKRDLVTAWKWFTLAKRRHGETARGELKRKANQEIRDKKVERNIWMEAAKLVLQRAGADTKGDELALKTRLEKMPSGLDDRRIEYLRLRTDELVNQEVSGGSPEQIVFRQELENRVNNGEITRKEADRLYLKKCPFADLPKLSLSMKKEDKAEAERQASLFEFKEDPWENQ